MVGCVAQNICCTSDGQYIPLPLYRGSGLRSISLLPIVERQRSNGSLKYFASRNVNYHPALPPKSFGPMSPQDNENRTDIPFEREIHPRFEAPSYTSIGEFTVWVVRSRLARISGLPVPFVVRAG